MINRYLEILQLYPGASEEEVKAAYRKLAKKYHPDVYPEEGAKHFIEISEAYHFLLESGPQPHNEEVNYDYDPESFGYREMRKRAREKAESEARSQAHYELTFLNKFYFIMRITGLFVVAFNILLIADLVLEPIESEELIVYSSPDSEKFFYTIIFEDGKKMIIETQSRTVDNLAIVRASPIFKKIKNATFIADGTSLQLNSFEGIYNNPLFYIILFLIAISYGMVWFMQDSIRNKFTINLLFIFVALIQLVLFLLD